MATVVRALLRLVGYPRPKPEDEEGVITGVGDVPPSINPTTTVQEKTPSEPDRSVISDDLTLYRLMVGINTPSHLRGKRERPADNIGLYARVVHEEQRSEDKYRVFSAVINACYFLQIIIAAALTALGAANADNKAITAFGAFNTIIAGFLTYLKGSGLPERLKYFANEWKKTREFIEQRERDFAYEGCTLDVYEVVEKVREMYAATKRDIEMNTPDSYNSVTAIRHNPGTGVGVGSVPVGVDPAKAEEVANKLRNLDNTVRRLRARVEKTVEGVEEKAHEMHDKVHEVQEKAHAIHDEEKRMAAELRALGKAIIPGTADDSQRPRRPREVSNGGTDESRTVVNSGN